MIKLTLFQFEECPYCAKVRAKLEELGLEYQKVNVPRDREHSLRKELFKKSGVPTVPVLKITTDNEEKFLGESEEIISYLKRYFKYFK